MKRPKILLINTCTYRQILVYPIGLDYLKSYLEQNGFTDVATLDLALVSESEYRQRLTQALLETSYDIVAFSFRNITDQLYLGRQYAAAVKKLTGWARQILAAQKQRALIVVGGAGFSLAPEYFFHDFEIDYGVAGEGEVAFLNLVKAWVAKTLPPKGVLANPVSLKSISYQRGTWGYLPEYQAVGTWGNIQSKRGCNRRCVYCSYPVIEGRLFRLRDPHIVAQEARQLEEVGFDKLYFVDATFNNPLLHAKEILRAFKKEKVTAEWRGFFNPDVDQELLDLIRETNGDQVIKFTIESGSDKMLSILQKGFNAQYIERAVNLCQKNKLGYAFTVMFGAPGETLETVQETCDFITRLQPNHVSAGMGVFIYPKTQLAAQTKGEHWHQETDLLAGAHIPFDRQKWKPLIENSMEKAGIEFVIYDELEYLNQQVF